jgi:type II secretory pathway pseudopilin PulG
MMLTGRDIPKLIGPLLAALVMSVIAGLLVWGSQIDADKAEQERNAATAARNQIEQRLRQVRTEEQDIKERTQLLQQLQNTGITGEEKRLDWMELLRDVQRELRIPGMSYEFGIQTPLDKGGDANYAWYASPLRVQLRLLHEEDLLNFLAALQKNAKAQVIVRHCTLSPLPAQADARQSLAKLAAECEMQWLTARHVSEKK